jgi:hypothetical protein
VFKITDNTLTFSHLDTLEGSEAIGSIDKTMRQSLTLRDESAKKFVKCSVKYLNPRTGKLTSVVVGSGKGDTLKLEDRCSSKEQAKLRATAALKRGSSVVKGDISLKAGNPYFVAGINFDLPDYGSYSGKYHITQSIHVLTPENYTTSGEVKYVG